MDNTVGLLSALGADCWTGREFVQPRLNPRWARVFLDSLSRIKRPDSAYDPRFPKEDDMDTTTLLIIIVVLLLLGGGWYGRGRWY